MKKVRYTEGVISREVSLYVDLIHSLTYLMLCLVWVMQEKNIALTEHHSNVSNSIIPFLSSNVTEKFL